MLGMIKSLLDSIEKRLYVFMSIFREVIQGIRSLFDLKGIVNLVFGSKQYNLSVKVSFQKVKAHCRNWVV